MLCDRAPPLALLLVSSTACLVAFCVSCVLGSERESSFPAEAVFRLVGHVPLSSHGPASCMNMCRPRAEHHEDDRHGDAQEGVLCVNTIVVWCIAVSEHILNGSTLSNFSVDPTLRAVHWVGSWCLPSGRRLTLRDAPPVQSVPLIAAPKDSRWTSDGCTHVAAASEVVSSYSSTWRWILRIRSA